MLLSNDSKEGQLVAHTLGELAKKNKQSSDNVIRIKEAASKMTGLFDALAFCLSEKNDLLSQWRGYANNAHGMSIGFSEEYLSCLIDSKTKTKSKLFLEKVTYESAEQEELVMPTYNKIIECIDNGAFAPYMAKTTIADKMEIENHNKKIQEQENSIYFSIIELIGHFYLLKSSAFREEFEWRLFSLLPKGNNEKIDFHPCHNTIKPYRSLKLDTLKNSSIIEVVLGPKNITPKYVIEALLKQNGFNGVKVSTSEASYI